MSSGGYSNPVALHDNTISLPKSTNSGPEMWTSEKKTKMELFGVINKKYVYVFSDFSSKLYLCVNQIQDYKLK